VDESRLNMGNTYSSPPDYYYDIEFPEPISDSDLPKIEKQMKKIAKQGLKMEKHFISEDFVAS